ncbi:hypothetical protein [Fibrella aquatica]|uniref:hypothetical protein n=1 Tax=Fibrella aquatica TaxID=3242487 RepID=UPI0035203563
MKRPAAFLLAALTLIGACKSTEPIIPIPTDHIVLRQGQSTITSAGVTVFADTVNVFICPKDASCFAPDNLSASLRLVRNQETRSVRLFAWFGGSTRRNGGISDSTSVLFGNRLYKVILTGQYTGETTAGVTGRALLHVALLDQ